jgi:hypothetical protein
MKLIYSFTLKENRVVYDIPITKEIDRFTRFDPETKKVKIEQRGIYAAGLKSGNSTTPGILFSEYRENPKELKRLAQEAVMNRSTSGDGGHREKGEIKAPFMPPSLRNGTFQTDKEMFGEDQGNMKQLVKQAVDVRVSN